MMRRVLVGLCAVALTGCAARIQPHRWTAHVALALSAGCDAADLATTMYWRGAATVVERNPLLVATQDFPLAFTARKWGLATAVNAAGFAVHERHPAVTSLLLFGNAALKCSLAARNDRIGRGAR